MMQVLALAKWAWCSFNSGEITAQQEVAEATKMMRRCSTSENGSIGRAKFAEYYTQTAGEMFR